MLPRRAVAILLAGIASMPLAPIALPIPVASAHPVDIVVEAESANASTGQPVNVASATGGTAWSMSDNGTFTLTWFAEHAGAYHISVVAKGFAAAGFFPVINMFDDGHSIGHWLVNDTFVRYTAADAVTNANHTLTLSFSNALPTHDRRLTIDYFEMILTSVGDPPSQWLEAETFANHSAGSAFFDASASASEALGIFSNGTIRTSFAGPANHTDYDLTVFARGTMLLGVGASFRVKIDSFLVGSFVATETGLWNTYTTHVSLLPGNHTLSISYVNNQRSATEDRNLFVDAVRLLKADPAPPGSGAVRYEAELFPTHTDVGRVIVDPAASNGERYTQYSNGGISMPYPTSLAGNATFLILARGSIANGTWPAMSLLIDGATIGSWSVSTTSFQTFSVTSNLAPGDHTLEIRFTNDGQTSTQDRNLYLDLIDIIPPGLALPPPVPTPGPSEWAMDGFEPGNSRFNPHEATITTQNVATLGLLWNFVTPRAVTATPAVFEGRVYFGDWGGNVYAVSAANGSLLWSWNVSTLGYGNVTDAPAVADGRVYFGTQRGWLLAFDTDAGALQWATQLDTFNATHVWAAPMISGGKVFLGVASDQEAKTFTATPDFRGSIQRIDDATGHVDWKTYTVPPGFTGGPVWGTLSLDPVAHRVFAGTGNAYSQPVNNRTDALLALDMDTGAILWSYQAVGGDVWTANNGVGPDADFGSPTHLWTLPNGRPLVGAGNKDGDLYAMDPANGTVVYHTKYSSYEAYLGPGGFAYGRNFWTFVTDKRVMSTDPATGAILWNATLTASTFAGVSIADGIVFSGSTDGNLFALDAGTGSLLWQGAIPGATGAGIWVAPAIAEGAIYAPWSINGFVFRGGGVAAFGPSSS